MEDRMKQLKEIDAAIDAMDENRINAGLDALKSMEEKPLDIEAPEDFAARIFELNRRTIKMMKPKKQMKIAVAAALVAVMGITAYAATTMNLFSFGDGDKYVTMRTPGEMSEQEARDIVAADRDVEIPDGAQLQADTQDYVFESVTEAAEKLGMKIPVPSAMPEMALEDAKGAITEFGNSSKSSTAWLTYGDAQGRMFGITVVRDMMAEDSFSYSTSDMDPGSMGSYQSKSGIQYTTLTESNDDGSKTAYIATTLQGEYEYSLVFFGFDDAERAAIIDSADLSVLN